MKPPINSWSLKSRHIFDYYRYMGLDVEVPFHLNEEEEEEVCRELRAGQKNEEVVGSYSTGFRFLSRVSY